MENRIGELKKKFIDIYGGSEKDIRIFASPGRVNLIGEHIDYCGGLVFPAALTLDTIIAARIRNDKFLNVAATDIPDRGNIFFDDINKARNLKWGNYQAGVADELIKDGYKLTGADMLFDVTVPIASGLSSSASIEVATAIALITLSNEIYDGNKPLDLVYIAKISQKAENNFCGVNCGIMDQFASSLGKKNCAIVLDCSTLYYKYVPFKIDGYSIVLGDTKKKRGLADSKYNERRSEVDRGFEVLKKYMPDKKDLCSVNGEEFAEFGNKIENSVIYKRVKHVILENERVKKAVTVLEKNDLDAFGRLLKEAGDSIRDLYEVTGFELDTMVEEAWKIPGVAGARMTGAGFGGCTVNIVKNDCIDNFIEQVGNRYKEKTGIKPEFYISEPGDGAREIK